VYLAVHQGIEQVVPYTLSLSYSQFAHLDVYAACTGRTHFNLKQAKNNTAQISKIVGLLFKT